MRKTDFYIAISPKFGKVKHYFQKVRGLGETLVAPDGSLVEIRLDKRFGNWFITEASTGMLLTTGVFKTRAGAIASLTPELLDFAVSVLRRPEMITAAERLDSYKERVRKFK